MVMELGDYVQVTSYRWRGMSKRRSYPNYAKGVVTKLYKSDFVLVTWDKSGAQEDNWRHMVVNSVARSRLHENSLTVLKKLGGPW